MEKEYNKLFKKLKKCVLEDDNSEGHEIQDEIYRKFIKDISLQKFKNLEEIELFASLIKKYVIKYDKNRWYA